MKSDLDRFPGCGAYEWHVAENKVFWSDGLLKLFGVSKAPTTEEGFSTLVHPEDRVRFDAQTVWFLEAGDSYTQEFRVIRPDGAIRHIHDRGEIERGPDGKALILRGLNVDVTEQRLHQASGQLAGADPFLQVIECAPWGIWIIDSDFRLIQMSDDAARMFDDAASLVTRDCAELFRQIWSDPFAGAVITEIRQALATGAPRKVPLGPMRGAGETSTDPDEVMLAPINLPDGRGGVACYIIGQTHRTRQDALLRESEERLKLAYEASGMGAWDIDLAMGDAIWTPELYDILGLDRARPASAELFFDHVHPDDVTSLRASFNRSVETGEIMEAGFRIRRGDGVIRHIAGRGRVVRYVDGVPARMIGVNYDVTERRRMERQIRENEKELRLILDNAIGFIGLLHPDGTLLEANATALSAGGLAREDVIGRMLWDTPWWSFDPEMAAGLRAAVVRAGTGEAVRYDAVVRMQGDTRMIIDMLLSPIMDDEGQVHRIVASGFDITKREQALESVRLLMGEINHRSKNTLALIQAIARQIWRANRENFFERFTSRLQALADSQDLLVKNKVDGAFIEDIAKSQLAHFGEILGTRIHLNGPRIGVNADAAQAIGMAFHELATNAGKYGALTLHDSLSFRPFQSYPMPLLDGI